MERYTKTTWINGSLPSINAEKLNNIENGIETNRNRLIELSDERINEMIDEKLGVIENGSY